MASEVGDQGQDSMYEMIRYEVREGIATIAFDRPDKLNAYTPAMGDETIAAF